MLCDHMPNSNEPNNKRSLIKVFKGEEQQKCSQQRIPLARRDVLLTKNIAYYLDLEIRFYYLLGSDRLY